MAELKENEDDIPKLSADTLAVLGDFYSERAQDEKRFEDLKAQMEQQQCETPLSMNMFSEDWNASQFWYSDDTATLLARQLIDGATTDTKIAIVSAPSAFIQVKNQLASASEVPQITLLEFDQRFDVFREFVHYDFQSPTKLPGDLKGKFDRVLCDPPFLSTDCQTKAALTVRWLSKKNALKPQESSSRWILCTGERMEELIHKLYPGIRTTTFRPRHAQDRLSNDFRCYANFESEIWKMG
ncbi:MAG: hypothetical protein LQ338_006314 [Usnochroma carphineum]|nr:MAG: hypothetical protein LQ338_006314 [Usnochroma carphineum]